MCQTSNFDLSMTILNPFHVQNLEFFTTFISLSEHLWHFTGIKIKKIWASQTFKTENPTEELIK